MKRGWAGLAMLQTSIGPWLPTNRSESLRQTLSSHIPALNLSHDARVVTVNGIEDSHLAAEGHEDQNLAP